MGYYDDEIGIYVFLFVVGVIVFIILSANTASIAQNNAITQCKEQGYDNFISYKRGFLGKTPRGLVCGTTHDRMVYEGKITVIEGNSNSSIQKQYFKVSQEE